MDGFLLTFIPLFVAVDVIGTLPLYLSLTHGLAQPRKTKIVGQSLLTAFIIGILFLLVGKWILAALGVLVSDFKIAGGTVLLAISLTDLLQSGKAQRVPAETVGAVPIGTPLVVGPAVLTTMIILLDAHGLPMTVLAFVLNLAIVWVVFTHADAITRVLGKAGSKAVSKLASLLLAAIAVMMIRKGIVETLTQAAQR